MLDDNFSSNSDTAEVKEEEEILPEDEKLDLSDGDDPDAAADKEETDENYMNFVVMKEMYPNGDREFSF